MNYIKKERINKSINYRIRRLFSYFLKGLLITLPIYATYRIIRSLVESIDEVLLLETPGLGFLIVVGVIMLIGLIGSNFLTQPIFELIDGILNKIPFVKTIYGSVKDLIEAFVGEKNKFSKPVIVELSPGIFKPGFITQDELIDLNLPGMAAVYFPHSYAFSGNLFLVNKDKIQVFKGSSSALMKFIVSGGVSELDKSNTETEL
jgi:uncharacterized membrane protein